MIETSTAAHADPNDPAIAAILAFDLATLADTDDAEIAALLAPLTAAAPALREYSEDDVWTPAEEAVAAALDFVSSFSKPSGDDDAWMHRGGKLDRLRRMQYLHRERLIRDRLGEFPGYELSVYEWVGTIHIYEVEADTGRRRQILKIGIDATRREVELSIAAWKAGHETGLREGAGHVRRGIKELLEIEAD